MIKPSNLEVSSNADSKAQHLTEEVKKKAISYGFDLVGIVSPADLDAVPSFWIGHRDYRAYTKKTIDYMADVKSVIILGARVWDDVFEIMLKVRDHYEYPEEWRGRLYARRILRFLQRQGYNAILEDDWLLSKKRMAQLAGFGNFGKNTLIINPSFGPWFRLRSVLTNAVLVPDKPFTEDICGACEDCVKACPVGALTPYSLDPDKCLLGLTWAQRESPEYSELWQRYSPMLTPNTYVMCTTCQKACRYGRDFRGIK